MKQAHHFAGLSWNFRRIYLEPFWVNVIMDVRRLCGKAFIDDRNQFRPILTNWIHNVQCTLCDDIACFYWIEITLPEFIVPGRTCHTGVSFPFNIHGTCWGDEQHGKVTDIWMGKNKNRASWPQEALKSSAHQSHVAWLLQHYQTNALKQAGCVHLAGFHRDDMQVPMCGSWIMPFLLRLRFTAGVRIAMVIAIRPRVTPHHLRIGHALPDCLPENVFIVRPFLLFTFTIHADRLMVIGG